MSEHQATVHIVDDDEAVRDSLELLLDTLQITCQSYENAQVFLQGAQDDPEMLVRPGCVVLDIRMPLMSGMECQHQMQQMGSTLPIIFMTGHGDVPMAVEAMKRGAMEFIQKPFREQELVDAIQRALTMSEERAAHSQALDTHRQRFALLTNRERQIFNCIVDGKANKVIALDLHLSQRTVEIHRAKVMEKMGAANLAELVKMSVLLGEEAKTEVQ